MSICVTDIGNTNTKLALFQEGSLRKFISVSSKMEDTASLERFLKENSISEIFITSVNDKSLLMLTTFLSEMSICYTLFDPQKSKLALDVEEPHLVGQDRIANAYGALHHFPCNNCLVIDIGSAVNFDLIAKEGSFIGGAIYPGVQASSRALSSFSEKLPLIEISKPNSALGKDTQSDIKSGIYFGLLGAIERISAELCFEMGSASSVKIIATGGAFQQSDMNTSDNIEQFTSDLKDLVDIIDPYLTLVGVYELYKEQSLKKQEKE